MTSYEYQVVPAPRKAKAPRKVKGPEAKFAVTLTDVMNEMAADGWEYQRAETLPSDERQGFTGKTTKYHSVLVFRRAVEAEVPTIEPVTAEPVVTPPAPIPAPVEEPRLTRQEPATEGFLQDASETEETRDETA